MGVADVRGKAVLVVGGTRGISERFAELGAEVGLTGRDAEQVSGVADEISDVVVFLASESYSFVTGAVYPVDGGWTAW